MMMYVELIWSHDIAAFTVVPPHVMHLPKKKYDRLKDYLTYSMLSKSFTYSRKWPRWPSYKRAIYMHVPDTPGTMVRVWSKGQPWPKDAPEVSSRAPFGVFNVRYLRPNGTKYIYFDTVHKTIRETFAAFDQRNSPPRPAALEARPYLDPKTCPHIPTARGENGVCKMCGHSFLKPPPEPTELEKWIERARRSKEPSPIETLEDRSMWPPGCPPDTAEVRVVLSRWMVTDVRSDKRGPERGALFGERFPYQSAIRVEIRKAGCSTWHSISAPNPYMTLFEKKE